MPEELETVTQHAAEPFAKSLRVMVLMNVIAPYHKPMLDRLSQRFGAFRVLLSTPMESNRPWKLEWSGLDVAVQKTITLNRRWHHPQGFSEPLFVHVPVDTPLQLGRWRPDVVISWEMGMRTILAATYCALSRAKLMVWAEFAESTEFGRGAMRQRIRSVLHRAVDGFLVTGRSGARYLEAIGVARAKLHQIAYTIDVARFANAAALRQPAEERRLLYVGQLIERKGLVGFVEAASRWAERHPDRQLSLTFAGDGPLRAQLQSASVPANLRLIFTGNVAYEDLPGVYGQADILAFPTLADTWGVVVNEALAAGVPVLGSVYGQAVTELVQDGRNGWTFCADSADELACALDRALSTGDQELARMREYARVTALRTTPDNLADMVERAVVECAAGASHTP
jgi:glycosyltransferase involved in cell wall biosynthesis